MKRRLRLYPFLLIAGVLLLWPGVRARAISIAFSPGDVFISLETGPVQWRTSDGMLNRILVQTVSGAGEDGRASTPTGDDKRRNS